MYYDPKDNDRIRASTARGTTHIGLQHRRYCTKCNTYKPLKEGYKRYPNFICADCVQHMKDLKKEREHHERHGGYGPDEI